MGNVTHGREICCVRKSPRILQKRLLFRAVCLHLWNALQPHFERGFFGHVHLCWTSFTHHPGYLFLQAITSLFPRLWSIVKLIFLELKLLELLWGSLAWAALGIRLLWEPERSRWRFCTTTEHGGKDLNCSRNCLSYSQYFLSKKLCNYVRNTERNVQKILDQSLLLQDLERSPSGFLHKPQRKENKAQFLFIYLCIYLLVFTVSLCFVLLSLQCISESAIVKWQGTWQQKWKKWVVLKSIYISALCAEARRALHYWL